MKTGLGEMNLVQGINLSWVSMGRVCSDKLGVSGLSVQ